MAVAERDMGAIGTKDPEEDRGDWGVGRRDQEFWNSHRPLEECDAASGVFTNSTERCNPKLWLKPFQREHTNAPSLSVPSVK